MTADEVRTIMWLNTFGNEENSSNLSEVLIDNVQIRYWLEASTQTECRKKQFDTIALGNDELNLNNLFQSVNQKLLELLLEIEAERDQQKLL